MPPIIEKKSHDTSSKEQEMKIWNDSEVELLKRWGEVSSSYRFLHDRAFRIFQLRNYCFTIPVIVLSTISGTASFSIASFPVNLQTYVPMVIGGINIFVGIVQTIAQFLRISELAESPRVASTAYGKFSRNIATELSLPPNNRTYNGIDFVQMCRAEMDRLLEQSPIIPMNLLSDFDRNPTFENITKPDVLKITEIREYKPSKDERVQNIVSGATEQFKNFHLQQPDHPDPSNKPNINSVPNINSIINKSKENVNKRFEEKKNELSELGNNKIVSGLFKNNKFLNSIPTDSFQKSYIDIKKEQAKELNNVLPLIKSNLEEKTESLKNNARNTVNNVVDDTTEDIDNFIEIQQNDIENNINEIKNNANEIKKTVTTNANNIANNIVNKTENIKKNVSIKVNNVSNVVNKASNVVNNTINDINENIDNIENTGLDKI